MIFEKKMITNGLKAFQFKQEKNHIFTLEWM